MTVQHDTRPDQTSPPTPVARWPRITATVLGILGGVAAFVGAFILFAGEDQYIGLWGELSWRVGDIATGWGYGLLAGGTAAMAGAATWYAMNVRRS